MNVGNKLMVSGVCCDKGKHKIRTKVQLTPTFRVGVSAASRLAFGFSFFSVSILFAQTQSMMNDIDDRLNDSCVGVSHNAIGVSVLIDL